MNALLRRLLARFLTLGVEGEPDPEPAEAADDLDEGTGDESLDDLMDAVEPEPGKVADKDDLGDAGLKEAKRRNEELQRELETERARQRSAPPPPPARDAQFEAEEAELARARAAGDAGALRWTEWQINSNRTLRANSQNSERALSEARDLADKTEFGKLEITKPGIYKRYAARVEQTLAEARRNGASPPRTAILRLLLGDDLINGKVKTKQPKTKSEPTVDRGRMPASRSDVRGGQKGMTERQKRIARLENVII